MPNLSAKARQWRARNHRLVSLIVLMAAVSVLLVGAAAGTAAIMRFMYAGQIVAMREQYSEELERLRSSYDERLEDKDIMIARALDKFDRLSRQTERAAKTADAAAEKANVAASQASTAAKDVQRIVPKPIDPKDVKVPDWLNTP